jgi:hypothetical protein
MLRTKPSRKRHSKHFNKTTSKEKETTDADEMSLESPSESSPSQVDDITKAMSALKFVPNSIKFGSRARPGFSKKKPAPSQG